MNFESSEITSIIIAVIGGLLTYAGVWVKARSDREVQEPASWQMLVGEMKAFFQEQLAERDRRIDALEEREEARAAYDTWLATLSLPRPPFLTFVEWVNLRRKDDE